MTNLDLTHPQYWQEVQSIADYLASEAMEDNKGDRDDAKDSIQDSRLHEAIDGHELVIYYQGNDTVLRHSPNGDAWLECYDAESIGKLVLEKGIDGVRAVQAFFALEADVQRILDDALDDAEADWDNKNPVSL